MMRLTQSEGHVAEEATSVALGEADTSQADCLFYIFVSDMNGWEDDRRN